MINWMFFPQTDKTPNHLAKIIKIFEDKSKEIDSERHLDDKNLHSDKVLKIISPLLEKIGYKVEQSKRTEDRINIPVLFGKNGKKTLAFEVDAFSEEFKTVIEVEAGRGVLNNQFLKDFYEACMMSDVDYIVIAVKNIYSSTGNKDFETVCNFFKALYSSNRITIPLKGILIIGY